MAVPVVGLPAGLLVEALSAVAAAGRRLEVAQACLPLLLEVPGVRAAAVVERAGTDVVVQGSAGYGCGSMAPGQRIPLASGLPVTEAVRTDRAVVQGTGPAWVAVPFRRRGSGALLLSLDVAPPAELAEVTTLARAVGEALVRAGEGEQARDDLDRFAAALVPAPASATAVEMVSRSLPVDGAVGGDVLLCLDDGRGGTWLVAADVCGSGLHAALLGRSVAATATAVAPYCSGPSALLQDLERSLRPVVGTGSFVTAVVVHLHVRGATVASAGHPPPLLLSSAGAVAVEVSPGPPLALETGSSEAWEQTAVTLPPGTVLLLHTDGLVDRSGRPGVDPALLVAGLALDDLAAVADQVLRSAERLGPASDDVSLLLVRP